MDNETENEPMKPVKDSNSLTSNHQPPIEEDNTDQWLSNPPSILIPIADETGIEIGDSCGLLVMDQMGNLRIMAELRSMSVLGMFEKKLEGNPNFGKFIPMQEKDILQSDILQKQFHQALIRMKKESLELIGVLEIHANGFESAVLTECSLEWNDVLNLMAIHQESRENGKCPQFTNPAFIKTRFIGQGSSFLSHKCLQITSKTKQNLLKSEIESKGIICGIICIANNIAHFFILSNNFKHLDSAIPIFEIDTIILTKMYRMIADNKLTPVSWFKISFGLQNLNTQTEQNQIKPNVMEEISKEMLE